MKKYKIFIDPGHGGADPGAVANGLVEKEINLVVSKELKRLLETKNIEVKMSREYDSYVGLRERCDIANSWGADIFVSIHHNAGGGSGWEIIHTIHTDTSQGDELAETIGREFTKTGQNMRRIFSRESTKYSGTDYFAVIRGTKMPAVITEFAFLDSTDHKNINTTEKLHIEAQAIFKGICNYLQICDDSIKIKVNREVINDNMDVQPYIKDGRVMVPVRFVAEALGKKVEWIEKEKTVVIYE